MYISDALNSNDLRTQGNRQIKIKGTIKKVCDLTSA